jgi:MFS transporter, FLVCR family, MFS-domain-containing protein 7
LPSFFIPEAPPSPPSASSAKAKIPLEQSYKALKGNISFYLIVIPFGVYTGFFNAASSLLNQILEPYGFSETDAGIAGALLILVGLVASAVVSPIIDRTKEYILSIKILVPLIAAMVSQLSCGFCKNSRAELLIDFLLMNRNANKA